MLFMGYWQFTDPRLFDNKSVKISGALDYPAIDRFNPFVFGSAFLHATPLFFMAIYVCIHRSLAKFIRNCCSNLFALDDTSIFDDLEDAALHGKTPSYFECLSGKAQKNWYTNEVYSRKVMGIKSLDDDQLEQLRTAKSGKQKLQGATNYKISNQFAYQD